MSDFIHRPPIGLVPGVADLKDFLNYPSIVGNVYYVDPANGNDGQDGLSFDNAFKTLPTAYAATTANQNDIVFLVGNASSISLSATLTWAKNYTHLIGIAAPTGVATRARIFQASTATGLSPLLNITATGCIFSNFYIFQGVDDATSLINVQVTGGRNYFDSVHFAGGGHATNAVDGCASLKLDAAEECRFVNCTFGVDTISAATGVTSVLFDSEAHRIKFEECYFTLYAGNAGATFIEVADSTGFDRYNVFRDCLFTNTSSTAMTSAFAIPAGVGAPRTFYLFNSILHGATDWESNDRGVVFLNTGTITAGGNAGIAQATNST